jgi:hypothetical protein
VRTKKLEFDGAASIRANETIPGIRQSRAAPRRIFRARRHPNGSPPPASAFQSIGLDLVEVSIAS